MHSAKSLFFLCRKFSHTLFIHTKNWWFSYSILSWIKCRGERTLFIPLISQSNTYLTHFQFMTFLSLSFDIFSLTFLFFHNVCCCCFVYTVNEGEIHIFSSSLSLWPRFNSPRKLRGLQQQTLITQWNFLVVFSEFYKSKKKLIKYFYHFKAKIHFCVLAHQNTR